MSKRLATGAAPEGIGIRRRNKEQRPAQILEAAFAEFSSRGFAATRLEDVARRIGVTKGTIYFYFPSKEELFKAVCRTQLLPVVERTEEIYASFEGSTVDLVRALVEHAYRHLVMNPPAREFIRLMIGEASRVPELVAFYSSEISERGSEVLRRVIERGVRRGEFRADAAVLLAESPDTLIAPVLLATLHRIMIGDAGSPDVRTQIEAHLAVVLDGVRVRVAADA